MEEYSNEAIKEITEEIRSRIVGELRIDIPTQIIYSTDASSYQIKPIAVAFPKEPEDLQAIVEVCSEWGLPITVRGSGSSLAGQAIGPGLIVDCSRYLDKEIAINPEEKTAWVQPGVILNRLNLAARRYGLQFGPDPASAERATMGGSIGNNASGAHSIDYGMAADHLEEAKVVLADGTLTSFKQIELPQAQEIAAKDTLEGAIYRSALKIRRHSADEIVRRWPRTWRRASGYNINYLIPWSPSIPANWKIWGGYSQRYPPVPENCINLAQLIAGSEGTLAVIREMKVRLVPIPKEKVLAVLAYKDSSEACQNVTDILEMRPTAVELIPQNLVQLAFSVPAYAGQAAILKPLFIENCLPPALLAVEFAGESLDELIAKARSLQNFAPILVAVGAEDQNRIWNVRKVGLGLLMSRPDASRPWSFIEDLSVPVEKLREFVDEMLRLFQEFEIEGEMYGHASAGCLHIRPMINIKSEQGVQLMREIAARAVRLTLSLGGAVSGEHGDGLARTEWNEMMFGKEILNAFRLLKGAADPNNILNPGKIVSLREEDAPPKMNESLRFDSRSKPLVWDAIFDFSAQGGLSGAIEQCNGAGVCRKYEGLMCPSYRATREELQSTRGRANIMRSYIYRTGDERENLRESVKNALDLCLACKGCKAECPSAVDVAKLKYEFLNDYYRSHPRKIRDYLFSYIDAIAKAAQPFRLIVNPSLRLLSRSGLQEKILEIDSRRVLPELSKQPMRSVWKKSTTGLKRNSQADQSAERVLFLSDPFTEYFYPEVGLAALQSLTMLGFHVDVIPVIGSGRIMISKGMLEPARRHVQKLTDAIYRLDPDGKCAVIGVEPSEITTFTDELIDLLPGRAGVRSLSGRAWGIEEFLVRKIGARPEVLADEKSWCGNAAMRIDNIPHLPPYFIFTPNNKLLLHEHCYQKSRNPNPDNFPVGAKASKQLLEDLGYSVTMIDAGCCSMAGAFGYEKEHYDVSMKVGEDRLFEAIRNSDAGTMIAASGYSCRTQIKDGTGRVAYHPIEIFYQRLINKAA